MKLENTVRRRGLCLIISAPSGAGKSTVAAALIDQEPDLLVSISVTTRLPRPGEQEGVAYHFRSQAEFDRMVAGRLLLEHATVFDKSYGTPRAPVEAALAAGRDVVFDVDWQGWRQLRASLPGDCVGLFLMPPSLAVLRERLGRRRGDSAEEVGRRMDAAISEMMHWKEFDHVLINDDLERCIAHARSVLHAARCSVARSPEVGWLLEAEA